ncbi:hypothetical protein PY479_10110 [Shewanella sp. A32]|uniref:hypothetical protein n=1 Tax=Shewanella sp. A32 TaxID=3031327 RepID=UPI0023B952FA|nr:hypothetical protein [Shewanella sp. A32]MDF0534625.1 hypothetical protein [Shewanella sp. A32]
MSELAGFELQEDRWVFRAGRENVTAARAQAANCQAFAEDDEDEQIDDVVRSCHNCVFRRWTPSSFQCLAIKPTRKK